MLFGLLQSGHSTNDKSLRNEILGHIFRRYELASPTCVGRKSSLCTLSAMMLLPLLSGCSGIDNNRVPVGTWEHADKQRYITIEPDGKEYRAVLFSVINNSSIEQSSKGSNRTALRERTLPATMQQGVLNLKADKDVNISVLYHPSGHLILVNGVTEFHRVPEELAQFTLSNLQ